MSAWLSDVRRKAAGRRSVSGAACVVLEHPAPARNPLVAQMPRHIEDAFLDDYVVPLHVGDILADRLPIAHAVWRGLIRGPSGVSCLRILRGLIPQGRGVASFFRNEGGLSEDGAFCVEMALGAGDFDAIVTLSVNQVREPRDTFDATHRRASTFLRERDALALTEMFVRALPDNSALWVVLGGLEEFLYGSSPHSTKLRTGLRRWLQLYLQNPRAIFVATSWSAVFSHLEVFDGAMSRSVFWGEGASAQDVELLHPVDQASATAGIETTLGVRFQPWADTCVHYAALGDGTIYMPWAQGSDDPARQALLDIGKVVEAHAGVGAIVLPIWCTGGGQSQTRESLSRAHPRMRWLPISHCEMSCLSAVSAGVATPRAEVVVAAWKARVEACLDAPL